MQEKNGGALKLNLLSSAVFEGTAAFTSVSIITTDLGLDGELKHKGAAIHNKVTICMLNLAIAYRIASNALENPGWDCWGGVI